MSCQCCSGLLHLLQAPQDFRSQREGFEQTVAFLKNVPFFRTHLPRSELPKVARILKREVWRPGERLVKQGEIGRSFFLIQEGTAKVITRAAPDEPEQTRAVLCTGDYFGAQSMTSERPNVASITAGEGTLLVTLSMSRNDFDEAGLRNILTFPKRAAIQEKGNSAGGSPQRKVAQVESKPSTEEAFIITAIQRNANLCALMQASGDKIQKLAVAAERRDVLKGTEIANQGRFSNEFFVVREGALEIVFNGPGQQSAEAAVGLSTMAERLARKQHCLQALVQPKGPVLNRSSVAMGALLSRSSGMPSEPDTHRGRALSFRGSELGLQQGQCKCNGSAREDARRDTSKIDTEAGRNPLLHLTESVPLGPGESFGELSLLYNTPHMGTLRATQDSVVYVISRQCFMTVLDRGHRRAEEYRTLLDEVPVLQPILSTERWELACKAIGIVHFKAGEQILTQNKVRQLLQWYIVASGSGVQIRNRQGPDGQMETITLAHLRRGSHFGERSLLRGDPSSQTSVLAGPGGMTCLMFDGDTVRILLGKVFRETTDLLPSLDTPIEEYIGRLAEGWSKYLKHSSSLDAPVTEISKLRKVCHLGKGGFAKVSLVEEVSSQHRYALKAMSKGYISEQGFEQQIRWERELLSMCDSPFLIRLHTTLADDQHLYFVLEAALGGNLADILYKSPEVFQTDSPRGSAVAFYCSCVIAALEHMHERCIVHRDVKPENVLLDERGYAKLCDMGFARFVLGKTNTHCGTPDYMAPEMIDFPHSHDVAVDWWALGVLTFELGSGQTPWEDEGVGDPMMRLLAIRRSQERHQITFPFHFPAMAKGFVNELLQKLPHRLGCKGGASAIRRHAMFNSKTLKFDFQALHAQTLPAPYSQNWVKPPCGDNGSEPDEDLGLEKDVSIYRSFLKEGHADWERLISPSH
eukprot:TRINITY_DN77137_c0_g1_i1.p1 TRINITY_DN77137_c0_g1~~TRINITY_DN77137_c0_g1_i1.p1  ORF type:complete len:922 (+),score=115.86 TRINITY_DN77137_c0_g1_i1:39-2804(+)